MFQNLRNLASKEVYGIVGALLIVGSYTCYIFCTMFNLVNEPTISNTYIYSNYFGIALLLFHLGNRAKSRNLRLLIYYPSAVLYCIVIFSYLLNDLFDVMVQSSVIVLPSIFLTWICFLLFTKRSWRTSRSSSSTFQSQG